jgi:hypothetical protein
VRRRSRSRHASRAGGRLPRDRRSVLDACESIKLPRHLLALPVPGRH